MIAVEDPTKTVEQKKNPETISKYETNETAQWPRSYIFLKLKLTLRFRGQDWIAFLTFTIVLVFFVMLFTFTRFDRELELHSWYSQLKFDSTAYQQVCSVNEIINIQLDEFKYEIFVIAMTSSDNNEVKLYNQ